MYRKSLWVILTESKPKCLGRARGHARRDRGLHVRRHQSRPKESELNKQGSHPGSYSHATSDGVEGKTPKRRILCQRGV
eukprot:5343432-Pyramimonas_sp.AAC.1